MFGHLEVTTQIKALQQPSVLFQFEIITIKSANKQDLIQFQVDEPFPVLLNYLGLNRSLMTAQFHLLASWSDLVGT